MVTTAPATAPEQNQANEDQGSDDRLEPELIAVFSLIRQYQTERGRFQLDRYLEVHPKDGKALFLYGLTYHREKKYGKALAYFDHALEQSPSYRPINYFRGWALYYLGELEESRDAFEQFLQRNPSEPDSHFAIGLIELDEQNLDEAQRRFEKAISILSNQGERADRKILSKAHARLSEVLEQRGDLNNAKEHLEIAAKLFPDHYEALYRLSRIYRRLGETEKADAAYQQFLAARERLHPGTSFPE